MAPGKGCIELIRTDTTFGLIMAASMVSVKHIFLFSPQQETQTDPDAPLKVLCRTEAALRT